MSKAFVLGNGLSRQCVDANHLKQLGHVYACNAIYQEFTPNVLVSTDTPISKRIQETGYALSNTMYTRKPMPKSGAIRIPSQYYGFSSGPAAVGIAAIDHNRSIYLVGFDMGPNKHGLFNNMYAGTEFYKPTSAAPTYTGNWVRQLLQVAKDFPKASFCRVIGDTTANIQELNGTPNLSNMSMEDFLNRINNTKEL